MTHHDTSQPGPAHQERELGGREPPLNRLIRIMLVNLGAGLVIAASWCSAARWPSSAC